LKNIKNKAFGKQGVLLFFCKPPSPFSYFAVLFPPHIFPLFTLAKTPE